MLWYELVVCGKIISMKLVLYLVTIVASFVILNFFAIYWSDGYTEGLLYAFLGGFGNTIPALIALVAGIIGILRVYVSSIGGFFAFLSGKIVGTVLGLLTLVAVFANGVLIYLKFQQTAGSAKNIYVEILGHPIFEIVIVAALIIALFLRNKKVMK